MAHKKAGGSSRNGRDSESKRLGVKKFGGEKVIAGNILVRQRGTKWHPGANVGIGKDHTLFALEQGAVAFRKKANGRTYVSVNPMTDHFSAVLGPTPGSALSGSPARKPSSQPFLISSIPRGLAASEASLAIIRLLPIPIEQSSPVSALTSALISSALGNSETGKSCSVPEKSRYASSSEAMTTVGAWRCSTAWTR